MERGRGGEGAIERKVVCSRQQAARTGKRQRAAAVHVGGFCGGLVERAEGSQLSAAGCPGQKAAAGCAQSKGGICEGGS